MEVQTEMLDFPTSPGETVWSSPTIDAVATDYDGKAKIGKLDVDANGSTAMRYRVGSIPTLLLFQGGQVKETIIGMTGKKDLEKKLASYIG